jgi:hypothetical protein
MAAMPLLNRKPETPYTVGLLMILGVILIIAVVRHPPFFLHEILGVR